MKNVFTYHGHASTPRIGEIVRRVLSSFAIAKFNAPLLLLILLPLAGYSQNCQLVAGEVSGPSDACGLSVATYSIYTEDASGFNWVVPALTTLVSGQGTNSIAIRYKRGFVSGNVSVEIVSSCGGIPENRTLEITKTPPEVRPISGPPIVCEYVGGTTPAIYSVEGNAEALQYSWAVSSTRMTIVAGQGTNSIQVLFAPTFKTGNVRVIARSGCGRSPSESYAVNIAKPDSAGVIAGTASGICPGNVVEYEINPVPGATSYNWTTTVPGAVIMDQGPKAAITFPAFTSGIVGVTAVGPCGDSPARNLNVSSTETTPVVIAGPTSACQGTVQTFSVEPTAGATYDWSVPEGSVISGGGGTASITVLIGAESGLVSVRPSVGCSPGGGSTLELTVDQCGPEPSPCKFDLYPIPTSGRLHLRFRTTDKGTYQIYVRHPITGVTLISSTGTYCRGDNEVCLDLSALQDGGYLFYIKTAEFSHNERIEVRH